MQSSLSTKVYFPTKFENQEQHNFKFQTNWKI